MAGGKETPRQKLIGIMYLVLMAMLAINVSDSVLNAFKGLRESLEASNVNVERDIRGIFQEFDKSMKENPARTKPLLDKAKEVEKTSGELYAYVGKLKDELVAMSGGINPEKHELNNYSDIDMVPRVYCEEHKGDELQKKINETRAKLLGLLDPKDRGSVDIVLGAKDPEHAVDGVKETWAEQNFGHGTPTTAGLTALVKIESDIKNAEAILLRKILSHLNEALVNLDSFAAVAVAPTSYLLVGQPYTSEIFLTAYDSRSNPEITINGAKVPSKDGKGLYTVNTSQEGIFKWVANVKIKQTDGQIKEYKTTEQTYQVARPSVVVSPDKMNVIYAGVDNPVSVSVPGVGLDKLRVTMSNGSINGSNGKYTALTKMTSGIAKVSVSAEIAPGKVEPMGSFDFRIKRIPDPVAKFAGKTGGSIGSGIVKSADRIFAIPEGFDFEAKFSVIKFTMILVKPRTDALVRQGKGLQLTDQMKKDLNGVTPGSRLIFDDIVASGPDGSERNLTPIVFNIN